MAKKEVKPTVQPLDTAEKAPKVAKKRSNTPVKDYLEELGIDTNDPHFYNGELEAERAANRFSAEDEGSFNKAVVG